MNWPPQLPSRIGLLFSGGVDSTILLHALLEESIEVTPIYVRCGLVWEDAERSAVDVILQREARANLQPLVELAAPMADLHGEHWSTTGDNTPDRWSSDEAVYLPGRNAALCMKAMLWCQLHDVPALAMATLASNPFADATEEFARSLSAALTACGGWVSILRPFESFSKSDILARWPSAPVELSLSCISPQQGEACGACNKCAERTRASEPRILNAARTS